jgi:hypothetical protein
MWERSKVTKEKGCVVVWKTVCGVERMSGAFDLPPQTTHDWWWAPSKSNLRDCPLITDSDGFSLVGGGCDCWVLSLIVEPMFLPYPAHKMYVTNYQLFSCS